MSTIETHPMLATELLGFQPQLLLDELMSAVNETIYESTARVEEYLNQWIDEKENAGEDVEPLKRELEHVSSYFYA
jgi:Mis12 protein